MNPPLPPPLPPHSSGGGGYPQQPPLPPPQHPNHSSAMHHAHHPQPHHHQNHQPHHPSHPNQPSYYPPPPPPPHHHHHHNQHPPPPYQQQHQGHSYPPHHPAHHPPHHHQPHHDPRMQPPLPWYPDAPPRHHGPPPPGYHPPQPPHMAPHRPALPPYPMDRPQGAYNAPPPPTSHYPPPNGPPMYHQQAPLPSIPPMSYVCRNCNLGGHWIHDCMKKQSQQHKQAAKPPASAGQPSEWQCKPCEKNFAMKSQHDAHMLTHEECWAPGCDFTASKRVVTSHYQTMHGQYAGSGLKEIEVEGQKFHVLVGNSPEDITKWREERRKKWPSESNVKRKNDQMTERVQAGDAPANKKLRKMPAQAPPGPSTEEGAAAVHDSTEDPALATEDAVPTSTLPSNSNESNQASAASPASKPGKTASSKKKSSKFCVKFIRNACEDGDECLFNHDIAAIPCKQFSTKGLCKRGDQCKFSHTAEVTPQEKLKQLQQQHQRHQASQVKEHKSSLLRKLLAKDIDKEHRHILQAFRYLVDHNFFQPSVDDDI